MAAAPARRLQRVADSTAVSVQLPLALTLRTHSSFDNFIAGGNRELVAQLRRLANADDATLFIAGGASAGKTHLLEASCRAADVHARAAVYVPLALHAELTPSVLEDLDACALICIDDIERVAGNAAWEQALFALYERARARQRVWIVSGRHKPAQCGFVLRDLANRLQTGLVYSVHSLTEDADKRALIAQRARERGLLLAEDAVDYLFTRYARDLGALLALLERIDRESLAQQRRLTIPFLRALLEGRTP